MVERWRYRSLTPVGKIQIINSLIASQTIYKLTCLPLPSLEFFEQYKRIICDFLWWKDNSSTVGYDRVIQDYADGGLKLVDLPSRDKALKSAWVEKILNDPSPNLVWYYVLPIQSSIIWECNIREKDIKNCTKSVCILRHIKDGLNGQESISSQKGLVTLRDIYDLSKDRFLTHIEITVKFGNVLNRKEYKLLKNSIPKFWLTMLRQRIIGETPTGLTQIPPGMKWLKFAYWQGVRKFDKTPDGNRTMWEVELGIDISETQWQTILLQCFKITLSTKLNYFQYRCVTKKLHMNIQLSRWSDKSPTCSYCSDVLQTTLHLQWECPRVQSILTALFKWFKKKPNIAQDLSTIEIIFCNYDGPHKELINTITLMVKQYIYAHKSTNQPLNFIAAMSRIIGMYKIEKLIAYNIRNKRSFIKKKMGSIYYTLKCFAHNTLSPS